MEGAFTILSSQLRVRPRIVELWSGAQNEERFRTRLSIHTIYGHFHQRGRSTTLRQLIPENNLERRPRCANSTRKQLGREGRPRCASSCRKKLGRSTAVCQLIQKTMCAERSASTIVLGIKPAPTKTDHKVGHHMLANDFRSLVTHCRKNPTLQSQASAIHPALARCTA